MKHYVMVKFKDGEFNGEVLGFLRDSYEKLCREIPEHMKAAEVETDCLASERNVDIIIRLTLASPESLPVYLKHPLHRGIADTLDAKVAVSCTIDTE